MIIKQATTGSGDQGMVCPPVVTVVPPPPDGAAAGVPNTPNRLNDDVENDTVLPATDAVNVVDVLSAFTWITTTPFAPLMGTDDNPTVTEPAFGGCTAWPVSVSTSLMSYRANNFLPAGAKAATGAHRASDDGTGVTIRRTDQFSAAPPVTEPLPVLSTRFTGPA